VGGLSGIVQVGAGSLHSLARSSAGSVWAWGYGADGELGSGDWQNHTTPVQVRGVGGSGFLSGITELGTGLGSHSLAIGSAGAAYAWGADLQGQLGNGGDRNNVNVPVQVVSINGLNSISTGSQHSLAVSQPRRTSTHYTYDQLYRLTQATTASRTNQYTYDPAGNRLSKVFSGSSTPYSYDRADRIQSAGAANYLVNAAGDTLSRGSDRLVYDEAHRLVCYQANSTTCTTATATATYTYNGDGLRWTTTTNASTRYWVTGIDTMVLDDGGYKYVYGLGLAYAVDSLGNTLTQHTDRLGSVRAETDTSGNVVQTYGTDEFGIVDAALTSGTQPTPFQYTGEPRDSETGLVYLRARSYDPAVGRFMQADPLRKSAAGIGGWNRYSYVGNNPIRFIDPTGSMAGKANPEGAGTNDGTGDLRIAQVAPPMPLPWPRQGVGTVDVDWKAILAALAASLTGLVAGNDQRPQQQYVVRGGLATAQSFRNKADEIDPTGRLLNASVQTFPNVPPEGLGAYLRNGQIGVTTLVQILAIPGATVFADPLFSPDTGEVINPYHALLGGITPEQAEALFLPNTRPNINRSR